jgi:hypothetical protein
MPARYSQSSPYKNTKYFRNALDIMKHRAITKQPDDVPFEINSIYALRPDKLAFDLYGDAGLWWVFAARNPNVIEDPIFDFQTGKRIFLPKKSTLDRDLGL